MINLVVGNTYKLIKPIKNKVKIVKLKFIDDNHKLLYFNYVKSSFLKKINLKKNKDVFDIVLSYNDLEGKTMSTYPTTIVNYEYYLNNKQVTIEEIPIKMTSSIIEQYTYINNLEDKIKESIIEYTTNQYIKINAYLDNNCLPFNKRLSEIINDIDFAFKNVPPLKDDIILFRGLNLPNIQDKKRNTNIKLAGYKGSYKGFISTSLLIHNTKMFQNKTGCVLKINVRKKSRCLFIEFISNIPNEQEVLLERNSILSINSFSNNIINTNLISPN